MKYFRAYIAIGILSIFSFRILAQDYSLNPTKLDVTGIAGDFMLSALIITNTSNDSIRLHLKRIKKELPPNWTSCFCFPDCLAPFRDTLTFSIAPNSSDSIKPNYNTDDTIPGTGTIVVTIYQVGFPDKIDTITFTGTTLPLGLNDHTKQSNFSLYPNPFNDFVTIKNDTKEPYSLSVYNLSGTMVFRNENMLTFTKSLNMSFLPEGVYLIRFEHLSGNISLKKIVKY